MNNVREEIRKKLCEIEEKENVKILFCVESGSRAWGFESPDSDYDVRFIYIRKPEYYLRLDKTTDVIEWQLDDVFDINGWDLKKVLSLLYSSNPTVFEWKNSPVVYLKHDKWEAVSCVADKYFSAKKSMYHYLNMAKNNYKSYINGDTVRIKKYFYILRPLLACEHIRQYNSPPPMLFSDLLIYMEEVFLAETEKLLAAKKNTSELGESNRILDLDGYIERKISEFESCVTGIKEESKDWSLLNELFFEYVLQETVS